MPALTRYGFSTGAGRIVRPDPLIRRMVLPPPSASMKDAGTQFPAFSGPDIKISEGKRGTARKASTGTLSGVPHCPAPETAPATCAQRLPAMTTAQDGGAPAARPSIPAPRVLIQLPRYGEMEKRFDPLVRGNNGHGTD